MVIDKKILDELTAKAKENPRLRRWTPSIWCRVG